MSFKVFIGIIVKVGKFGIDKNGVWLDSEVG